MGVSGLLEVGVGVFSDIAKSRPLKVGAMLK